MKIPVQAKYILMITLILLTSNLLGQNPYFIKDSIKNSGVKIINQGTLRNMRFCAIKGNNDTVFYSPSEVSEYRLKNGNRFFSKKINLDGEEKQLFVEELSNGDIDLLYYQENKTSKFVIRKDKKEIELKPDSYKNVLNELFANCKSSTHYIKRSRFKRKSLARLAKTYNSCDETPMVYPQFGISLHYIGLKLNAILPSPEAVEEMINDLNMNYSLGFGIFMNIPISDKHLFIRPEILYSSFKTSSSRIFHFPGGVHHEIELNSDITSVIVPVSFQYMFYTKKIRPFINLGPMLNINLKKELNYTSLSEIHQVEGISKTGVGIILGSGIEFPLNTNAFYIEARYIAPGKKNNNETINEKYIDFSLGIKF